MEPFYPLQALVCEQLLPRPARGVRVAATPSSPTTPTSPRTRRPGSSTAERYTAAMVERFGLGPGQPGRRDRQSTTATCSSTSRQRGIPVLGIEPAANVAAVAVREGHSARSWVLRRRDRARLVAAASSADLLIGNNVLAHVPDINDFVGRHEDPAQAGRRHHDGVPASAAPDRAEQFDTIYHEHFSYLSFTTARRVFAAHGLRLFDVEELPTHGGSLRIYGCHAETPPSPRPTVPRELSAREDAAGYSELETYLDFGVKGGRGQAADPRRRLIELKEAGAEHRRLRRAGKGNTMLNYCGDRPRLHRLHGRPEPAQAGQLPAGHPHPDPIARCSSRDTA